MALLTMRGIVKEFPGARALDGVDLTVREGEVHGLLGQNGAGKSTLIRVLSGMHRPDAGEIRWHDAPVALPNPTAALRHGIATIYQELDLVPGLSVAENIFLGHEPRSLGFNRRRAAERRAAELLARLGHPDIAPGGELGRLPAAGQQIVSMARALSYDARLIVMDEPSAVLANEEVANLFRIIRELTADDVAVVYITHRLAEIREIADRVTVLKDGRAAASGLPAATPTDVLVRHMTGARPEPRQPDRRPGTAPPEGAVLSVRNLSLSGEFADVSFDVRPGEILGLAGLVGAGRSEILETVYGARRATSGQVSVDGKVVRSGSVRAAVKAGLGLAPEERKSQGLLMLASTGVNIGLASLGAHSRIGWMDRRGETADAAEQADALGVRPPDPWRNVATLSGGNQQKVLLARWLLRECRVLLLDEPTRGVDVGARAELYALIRDLAARGVGIVLVSSEVPEVLTLADRVLVIREGRVVHEAPAAELDEHTVLALVMDGRTR